MSSGIFYPAVSGDDGYAYRTDSFNDSNLYVLFGYGNNGSVNNAFFRFVDVTIPQGSIIISAFIRFTAYIVRSGTTVKLNIQLNDVDNAVAPTSYAEYHTLVKTTSFTAWDDLPTWINDDKYDTPSIINEVQEIVNRAGFSSGNAIMALILDDGSTEDSAYRQPSSIDKSSGVEKAELHVEWEPPASFGSGIFYPAVSGDDGQFTDNGAFSDVGGIFYVGEYSGFSTHGFVRFPSVTIPSGATITAAYVRLGSWSASYGTDCNLNCYLNDVDDAVAPTNYSEAAGLALTSAIAWNNLTTWVYLSQYDTPSLLSILQGVINRAGWASGQAVQFVLKDNGSGTDSARLAVGFELGAGSIAELHVEWVEPGVAEHNGVRSNFNKASGKWYWEVTIDSGTTHFVGVANSFAGLNDFAGGDQHGFTYGSDGKRHNDGTPVDYGDTYTVGDVIGIALDLDNLKVFFSKNGVWQDSSNPEEGTDEAYNLPDRGPWYAIWSGFDASSVTANFGATTFTYDSPVGFMSFSRGTMTIAWDEDEIGSDISLSNFNKTGSTILGYPTCGESATIIAEGSALANISKLTGKWYWEVSIDIQKSAVIWTVPPTPDTSIRIGIATSAANPELLIGDDAQGYAIRPDGKIINQGITQDYGEIWGDAIDSSRTVIGIAVDMDDLKVWFSVNGVWQNGGNPFTGTNPAFTLPSMAFFPAASVAGMSQISC